MACNVFGTPMTPKTLNGLPRQKLPFNIFVKTPEYVEKETITRKELADVAMALKNAEGKDTNARSYVENMYTKMNFKSIYCALVLIYNATGERLRLHEFKYLYCIPVPAAPPTYIENGQWGAFHAVTINRVQDAGCSGAVIYRGQDGNGSEVDFFMGWDTRVLPIKSNVCVDFDVPGRYDSKEDGLLLSKVQSYSPYTIAERNDLISTGTIGMHHMAVVEFIHTLK